MPVRELSVLADVGLVQELLQSAGKRMTWGVWEVLLEMCRMQRRVKPGHWFHFPAERFLRETGMTKSTYIRARGVLLQAGLIASLPGSRRVTVRPNILYLQGKRSKWLELLMQAFDLEMTKRNAAIARLKARLAMVCEDPPLLTEVRKITLVSQVRRGRR